MVNLQESLFSFYHGVLGFELELSSWQLAPEPVLAHDACFRKPLMVAGSFFMCVCARVYPHGGVLTMVPVCTVPDPLEPKI